MKRRKFVSLALGLGLALGMTACGSTQKTVDKEKAEKKPAAGALVGVTMPTRSSERWIHDGDNLKKQLEQLGYKRPEAERAVTRARKDGAGLEQVIRDALMGLAG